jgi:hypothetical protein
MQIVIDCMLIVLPAEMLFTARLLDKACPGYDGHACSGKAKSSQSASSPMGTSFILNGWPD